MLLGLCCLEDRHQRIAEVHRADFAPLCSAYFNLVPRPIVAHTAPYRDDLLREVNVLPGDMAEYQTMRKLMEKTRGEARTIKQLNEVEKPGLEKQLSETTGLFKGKERKALSEKIEQVQHEIDDRLDRIHGIVKGAGYPDVQAFKRMFDKATSPAEQYNRDLAAWKRQVNGEKPPEKESIRKKLREMDAEIKRQGTRPRRKPQRNSRDMER